MTVPLQVVVHNNSQDLIGIDTLDDFATNYYLVNETIRVAWEINMHFFTLGWFKSHIMSNGKIF